MRILIAAFVAAGLLAVAQERAIAETPGTPTIQPVSSQSGDPSAGRRAGKPALTADRASSHLERAGFTNVYGLNLSSGVWRGKATQAGQIVPVEVDEDGTINAR